MTYQLAIIGGGPAGYTAAEKAAKNGLSVILFERNALGGVCLNEGCIPTKTLLYSAKMYDHFRIAGKYGLSCENFAVDMGKLQSRKTKIIRKLTAGIRSRLNNHGVTIVSGEAAVSEYGTNWFHIRCADEMYEAQRLLLATGSEVAIPPIPGLETVEYLTSKEALELKEVPEDLLIIGGGVIGMEFACFFNSLGCRVTVVEMLPEILGGVDAEIAGLYREECKKKGIIFYLSARVDRIGEGEVSITQENQKLNLTFSTVLVAAGRRPVFDKNLPLETDGKRLHITSNMRTSMPNVYACGDITGFSMLAHTAEREADVAVNHILGVPDEMHYDAIPGVVYTSPEVAWTGLTESELIREGISYHVRKLPMSYAGRFVVENEGLNGLCKILVSEDDRILGVHIFGSPASEFIVAACMAITQKLTVAEWLKTVFPHPTVSEILKEVIKE